MVDHAATLLPALRPLALDNMRCPLVVPVSLCRSRVAPGWIRVGGVLATLFGSYYFGAALDDADGRYPLFLYASTLAGRLLLSAAFAWLVASGQCEAPLLWLAAANVASGAALWCAMRRRSHLL